MPASHETVDRKFHYIYQDGKAVFKVAVVGWPMFPKRS